MENEIVKEIIITIDGTLMKSSGNAVEYRSLFNLVDGTAGTLEEFSKILDQNGDLTFFVKPPKEKCFEIAMQAVQWVGVASVPLLPYANTIKESVAIFFEFLKIKKSLKDEPLTKDKIQTNEAGNVVIRNNQGNITYIDNRKILNANIVAGAADNIGLNKKIDKIARAIQDNTKADSISFGDEDGRQLDLAKEDAGYLRYEEKTEERPDSVIGFIRSIDNKLFKGSLTIVDGEKQKSIPFEIVIKDLNKMEKVVSSLALAEAYKTKVRLIGERFQGEHGKIKKIIVNDIESPETPFNF
ncbi:MAG: hypothetical protein A2542_00140 [Parcubacteria group bacterium RIFOXYD2_FULL_52_8]|nr:MAG: hypothetical protein A2542_00140 [Parcubacteria group bacterium RIFOXYD2_FULL_52_8]